MDPSSGFFSDHQAKVSLIGGISTNLIHSATAEMNTGFGAIYLIGI